MCRLFAVCSADPTPIRRAFAALRVQSHEHKDGWGLVEFREGEPSPRVQHSTRSAFCCSQFQQLGGELAVQRLLVHVRLASVGQVTLSNAHPFHRHGWAFAHNGTVKRFADRRADFEGQIEPKHRAEIQGETDSERCFALFLSLLERRALLGVPVEPRQVARVVAEVMRTVDRTFDAGAPADAKSSLNFLASDGRIIVASRRGRTLFVAGDDRRRMIASEPLWHDDRWHPLDENEVVVIDEGLGLHRFPPAQLAE